MRSIFINVVRGSASMNGFELEDLKLPDDRNLPFEFAAFGEAIELAILYAEEEGSRQIRDYCSGMVTRIHALEARREYEFLPA